MAFNRTKAFEVSSGIVAEEGGAGVFWSNTIPPISGNEVDGDRLSDAQGRRWRFNSGGWVLDKDFSTSTLLSDEVLEIKQSEEMIILKPLINRGRIINRGIIRTPNLIPEEPEPFVQQDQFDYFNVPVNKTVIIPSTQIMHPGRILVNRGTIKNFGKILFTPTIDYILESQFPLELILPGEVVEIKARQQMLLKGPLRNQGLVKNKGKVVLI